MSLTKIEAHFRCDGCMKAFSVSLDPARKSKASIHDEALEALRGGDSTLSGGPSEQGDHDLCPDCTKFIDNAIENDTPTYEQVCAALNERAGV